jgi:hypothetical protein
MSSSHRLLIICSPHQTKTKLNLFLVKPKEIVAKTDQQLLELPVQQETYPAFSTSILIFLQWGPKRKIFFISPTSF